MPKVPRVQQVTAASYVPRVPMYTHSALIFGVALTIRLIHIWHVRDSLFFTVLLGDSRGYDEWAVRLAAGDWIGRDVFYQAPLYPYFLGVIYTVFGRDLMIVRIVQAVLGSGACVLLALAGARLFSRRVGVVAGLMLALYAPAIFLDALIQKSVLDVFLLCLILWLIGRLAVDAMGPMARLTCWFGLGTALGSLSLTRENALALVAVVLAWAAMKEWRRRKPGPKRQSLAPFAGALALLLGLTVILAPVAARNKVVGGGLYLTTSQFGTNLYIGNNRAADGTYMSLREGRGDPAYERQDATELAEQALRRRLSPAEVSSFWRERALQYIASQPLDWLQLLGRKLVLLFNATEMLDTEAQESHAEWSPPLRLAGYFGHFGILLPFAVLGVFSTWTDRSRLSILYAMAVTYAASVVLFFVFARYRYPLVPFVVLFAAAGVVRLPAFVREAPRGQQLFAAAAALAMAAFARWPVMSADVMRAITETNVGVALQAARRLDEATAHYRRAAEIRPDYAPAYNNLGVALRALGKRDEAIVAYRQALAHRPDYHEVHYNLATALLELGKPEEALAHFRTGRTSLPATAAAHNNLGVALASAGRRDEAIAQFRAALALEPQSATTLRNLGDALAKQRSYTEAIECFRRIVQLDPNNPGAHYELGNVLMEAGQLSEATAEYRETIRLAPDSAQAHNNLGVALAAQGYVDKAIPEFERALKLKPDFRDAERYLAKARRSRGQ